MGTTGRGGVLFITDGDQVLELFRVKLQTTNITAISQLKDADVHIAPNAEKLLDWSIDATLADNIVAKARAEATR